MMKKDFRDKWMENKVGYSLYSGVAFTLIGFVTSWLLFKDAPNLIGISTILFTVIISMPFINKLLETEEEIESKEKKSFFKEHEAIIDFFIYFFIGVFLVLFVISSISSSVVFGLNDLYGTKNAPIQEEPDNNLPNLPPLPTNENAEITRIFQNNFYVMLIAFILSIIYGSGALFLIVFNASIFASALTDAIKLKLPAGFGFMQAFPFVSCNFGIMFFHALPEVGAYLLAAISGGVLSKAIFREKLFSKRFYKVIKDCIILVLLSFILIIIAAIIEVKISKKLLSGDICMTVKNTLIIMSIALLLLLAVIFAEFRRKKLR
jgi:hypothetical protein